ncbi:MAG: hypothetical protein WCS52_07335 [bacterium]
MDYDSKQVSTLRKEGRLDEALEIGRELFKADSSDYLVVRALGWVLYDLAKRALSNNDVPMAKNMVAELDSLSLGADDQLLASKRDAMRKRTEPGSEILTEARVAAKNDNHVKALQLYRQAVKDIPTSVDAHTGLGWEIYRALALLLKDENVPINKIRSLLREYATLSLIEKPGLLHSLVLTIAIRVADQFPQFPGFVRWWNIANLRPEDWLHTTGKDGQEYDALAERLAETLYKSVKAGDNTQDMPWITDFVKQALDRCPNHKWLPYHYGKLLVHQARHGEARKFAIPIIRDNPHKFWAWDLLASTFENDETTLRKACLCKALMCRERDESFLCNVMQDLAMIMKAEGELPEAKHELERYLAVRAKKGWRVPEAIQSIQSEHWYSTVKPAHDNRDYYEKHAPAAGALLLADIPWVNAVVTTQIQANAEHPAHAFITVKKEKGLVDVSVRHTDFLALIGVKNGTPVMVKVDHNIVLALEPRTGEAWDVFPKEIAVISHVNPGKGLSTILFSLVDLCVAKHDMHEGLQDLPVGTLLEVSVQLDPVQRDPGKKFYRLLSFDITEKHPDTSLYREVSATFHMDEGRDFGLADNAYVSPKLIQEHNLHDGDILDINIISEINPRRRRQSWRVIGLSKTTTPRAEKMRNEVRW